MICVWESLAQWQAPSLQFSFLKHCGMEGAKCFPQKGYEAELTNSQFIKKQQLREEVFPKTMWQLASAPASGHTTKRVQCRPAESTES